MTLDIRLYGILDPAATPGADLASLAALAARGGRHDPAISRQARRRAHHGGAGPRHPRALSGTGVPLLINDRVDVALVAGAQGRASRPDRHLAARRSRHARAQTPSSGARSRARLISRAHGEGADRLRLHRRRVRDAATRTNARAPIGIEGLARLLGIARLLGLARDATPALPLGAIAGITEANAAQVIAAGADGIAVIGAIFARPDPLAAARMLAAHRRWRASLMRKQKAAS